MTRADLLLKRQHIEQGKLKTWARYGRPQHHQDHLLRDRILWYGLKLLGLYARGEANVRNPVIRRIDFFFDHLPDAFDGFTIHDCLDMVAAFEPMGLRILLNESLELQRDGQCIWLAGVDDPHYFGCSDAALAFADVPPNAFKLLLVHTPKIYAEAAQVGADLYLCGHTHGGQICLPGIGPIETHATCPRRYVRGCWQHDQVQGYTNVGCSASGVPVRFFCPPEIGLITPHRTAAPVRDAVPKQQRDMLPLA